MNNPKYLVTKRSKNHQMKKSKNHQMKRSKKYQNTLLTFSERSSNNHVMFLFCIKVMWVEVAVEQVELLNLRILCNVQVLSLIKTLMTRRFSWLVNQV